MNVNKISVTAPALSRDNLFEPTVSLQPNEFSAENDDENSIFTVDMNDHNQNVNDNNNGRNEKNIKKFKINYFEINNFTSHRWLFYIIYCFNFFKYFLSVI